MPKVGPLHNPHRYRDHVQSDWVVAVLLFLSKGYLPLSVSHFDLRGDPARHSQTPCRNRDTLRIRCAPVTVPQVQPMGSHSWVTSTVSRLFIWFRFLWQVTRLNLNLITTHPDRCAGLAFIGKSAYAFGPILFAQGAMLAGVIASRVPYRGESLLSFKLQIGGFVVFFVLVILGPLLMFTPQMARAKRKGLADYGLLAQHYVEEFQQKWIVGKSSSAELLGSGDVQSLADLGNSYALVRDMRSVPFGLEDISRLAAATAAPLVPLLLTVFSPEELIMRVVKIIF